jgi:hypothetical protein
MSLKRMLEPNSASATPPGSAKPRFGTLHGKEDGGPAFRWSMEANDRKMSSGSQVPNVIVDDSLADDQVN